MARTQIEQRLFENSGSGPLLREDILPLATPTTPGIVPSGGAAGQFFRVNASGDTYGFETPPNLTKTWFIHADSASFEDETFIYSAAAKTLTLKQNITARVWCQGGGGGGGGGAATKLGAGGGASGQCRIKTVFVPQGQVIPLTFGAAGWGGQGWPDDAAAMGKGGGTTSFGNYVSASGGNGGRGVVSLGNEFYLQGGQAISASGEITFSQSGDWGQSGVGGASTPNANPYGGMGGNSLFGTGGGITNVATGAVYGYPGAGYGSGGSGGAAVGAATAGGNGAPGCIVIERIG